MNDRISALMDGEVDEKSAARLIEALTRDCRFRDCGHRDDAGCALQAAVAAGRLDQRRLESYLKLQEELSFLAKQQDERALLERKRQGRIMGKALRARVKDKRG